MAEKEKKRKRPSQGDKERPSKRQSIAPNNATLKVSYQDSDNQLQPILASSPGLGAPSVQFKAYSKALDSNKSASIPKPASHSVLLHSSDHPKLDFTATSDSNRHLEHYVGVYDPASSSVKIIPAHAVTLRSSLRSETAEIEAQNAARSFAKQREELGMAFGTKKAKKALASKTVNAITGPTEKGVESAVLDSVKDASENLPVKDEVQSSLLAAKPIPKPNLDADKIENVYPVARLVPPADMRTLAVKDWQDAVKAGEEVKLSSRFVASRLQNVVGREDVQMLKALKYLLLLLEFNGALVGGRTKKVPQKDKLREKLSAWPEALVENVRRRFADGGDVPKWHSDNLMTHMAAISLYIDNWRTDTHDLREDLRLENKQMSQYFMELGCKVRPPSEKEQADFKIPNKAQAAQRRVAFLKLPLEFPRPRLPATKRR